MPLDVTITATRRPAILRKTLESFEKNLFSQYRKKRAIINVDPVGDEIDSQRVVDVCREFFEEVISNCPEEASFAKAFKWVWSHVSAEWIFHLEDDWELMRKVKITDLGDLLLKNPDLAMLHLPAFHASQKHLKAWGHFIPWNGEFYEVPAARRLQLGFCGHPTLIKSAFVRSTVLHLDDTKNPEKQFHHHNEKVLQEVSRWRYGWYGEPATPPSSPIVRDLGRHWAVANGWKKEGNKAFFTQWERVNEEACV